MPTVRGYQAPVRLEDAHRHASHALHAVHGMHGARPESASPRVIELSYVVPACNSAATIEATLRTLATTLDGRSVEIVVVQNGSTDGTSHPRCTRRGAG